MDLIAFMTHLSEQIWSMPFLVVFLAIGVVVTVVLRFVQFTHFVQAFRMVFLTKHQEQEASQGQEGQLTPLQAFINTLGANIGNGSIAGVPFAIAVGGPGAIFWMLLMSTFAISLRYAEAYLGMHFIGKARFNGATGGPMVYLSMLPAGSILAYTFAGVFFVYSIICGNLMQCNAVGVALQRTWGISPYVTAFFVLAFILYILIGGSERIVSFLNKLVPFKVAAFFVSALIVLIYHAASVPGAFVLIFKGAFMPWAIMGGAAGFTFQQMVTVGFQRGVFVNEAGLGSAALAYGNTSAKHAVKDSIMSMLGVYINTHVVCLMVALCVIASGVWNNGETSSALMIASYETVFGQYGGWIISFLAINFGVSVLVSYAYLSKVCWDFFMRNRLGFVFVILYAAWAFLGTYMPVAVAFASSDVICAAMFVINVFGLLWFLSLIRHELIVYENK